MTTAQQWPTQANVRAFYGEPGGPACTAGMVDLPYRMRIAWAPKDTITRFRCHTKVEKAFERIFAATLTHYGESKIQALGLDLFGGCYNLRQMRGGKSWSMHSWGIAVDLDPARNQLKWGRDRAVFAKPDYAKFWEIVESEGMLSLGRVRNCDWMHFQAARL